MYGAQSYVYLHVLCFGSIWRDDEGREGVDHRRQNVDAPGVVTVHVASVIQQMVAMTLVNAHLQNVGAWLQEGICRHAMACTMLVVDHL